MLRRTRAARSAGIGAIAQEERMTTIERSTWATKVGLARMLAGGVIMDVVTADQARVAEEAGAVAVMALERVPSDIRKFGGVARMSDPKLIMEIKDAVSIPVMAKCRIGHFAEAQILESLEVDYIDESEVLTPADEEHHIDKHLFKVPFVCGCRDIGEAVRHMRAVQKGIRQLQSMREDELFAAAKELRAPYDVVKQTAELGALPVPNFSAGGVATPADASLMRQLGAEAVFVGSGIFKSENPERYAAAIVKATTHYDNAEILAEVSAGLGEPMRGTSLGEIPPEERLAIRGW